MSSEARAVGASSLTKYLDGGCMDYYELRHTNLQRPGFDDSVVL